MFKVWTIPALKDNYIWLVSGNGTHAAVVDPGEEEPVVRALEREGLGLEAILITHHHRDHTGRVAGLASRFGIPVYGSGNPRSGATVALADGDEVRLPKADLVLQAIATPGHTQDHLCYLGGGILFSGDTLFAGGCGRLFEGSPEEMNGSLERLAAVPETTVLYCAHEYTLDNLRFALEVEPDNRQIRERIAECEASRSRGEPTVPSTIGLEKRTNPFLRCREPEVVAAASRFADCKLAPGVEVFGVVRRWKEEFA